MGFKSKIMKNSFSIKNDDHKFKIKVDEKLI